MPFDEDPAEERQHYPCICEEGEVEFIEETGRWECSFCDFSAVGEKESG